jgi:hypothetical protein
MKRLFLFCSAVPLLLAACQPATLHLSIKAPSGTNQGRPLYMLVRKVDPKQYATESYDDVSARAFQPDASVLHKEIIYPGTLRRIPVKIPEDSSLAVSFLFTAPDGNWQSFLNAPVPQDLDVELQESRILSGMPAAPPPQENAPPSAEAAAAPAAPAPSKT